MEKSISTSRAPADRRKGFYVLCTAIWQGGDNLHAHRPYRKFSYIKDAVDDVIEKVLEDGGDVEFVDEGVLDNYQHISLIQRY